MKLYKINITFLIISIIELVVICLFSKQFKYKKCFVFLLIKHLNILNLFFIKNLRLEILLKLF